MLKRCNLLKNFLHNTSLLLTNLFPWWDKILLIYSKRQMTNADFAKFSSSFFITTLGRISDFLNVFFFFNFISLLLLYRTTEIGFWNVIYVSIWLNEHNILNVAVCYTILNVLESFIMYACHVILPFLFRFLSEIYKMASRQVNVKSSCLL